MMSKSIDATKIPSHVAIIMDGNGRWAKQRGEERLYGHQHGVRPIRETMEACKELNIKYLTLYAFSTENWKRSENEVEGLWELLVKSIHEEFKTLQDNNIRLRVIGDIDRLDAGVRQTLNACMEGTAMNDGFHIILALNYGGRDEIVHAARLISEEVRKGTLKAETIDEAIFSNYLYTKDIPDPELVIRTSGEIRMSNFLLWQAAYAELYFTETLWPDFNKNTFYEAITNFQNRERRFGGATVEPLQKPLN
ncbi:isoprenyl transferase [Bacteroidales bacterium OttesenSCG-928-J16]|nr:isoprenyl transferase [Bacteroidales bacterium OttesenSCG-928-J16]